MIYLADTNVMLRLIQRRHAQYAAARTALTRLYANGHQIQITAQNCIEFWNVTTRPSDRNGLGLNLQSADRLLGLFERTWSILPDSPEQYTEWRRLVLDFAVLGVQVHDARLVAAMKVNGLSHILTFNTGDFLRYAREGIVVVDPFTV